MGRRALTDPAAPETYAPGVEILLWLVPAAVVTVATMLWVGWWGRESRGEVDRETAAKRLGEALSREPKRRPGYAAPRRAPETSTGVAVRRTARPVVVSRRDQPAAESERRDRRAS
jgi:nitrogen fixation-related uncharacterized protein